MADPKILETFPNPAPQRDYVIEHTHHEFTSLCPMTGHPDFAHITVRYVADTPCVELKSLKLYFHAFRNEGIFFEAATNKICDFFVFHSHVTRDVKPPRAFQSATIVSARGFSAVPRSSQILLVAASKKIPSLRKAWK